MDELGSICLIVGTVWWLAVLVVEYALEYQSLIVDSQLPPPCSTEKKFSAQNLILISFPLALILLSEVRLLNSVGAIGLTCMLETFCLMGITAYEKVIKSHLSLCLTAGLSHTLVCYNIAPWCGFLVAIPLVCVGISCIVSLCVWFPDQIDEKEYTAMSVQYWLLDIWLVTSRICLVFATPCELDHFAFDYIGFLASLGVLALGCAHAYLFK
jgi:hypothetical protein